MPGVLVAAWLLVATAAAHPASAPPDDAPPAVARPAPPPGGAAPDGVLAVSPEGAVAAAAARIDRLLADRDRASAAPLDEHAFARRAYLDVVGRIPSLQELERFLADRGADRRERLIDALLASPGHRSHMTNLWADLLRQRDKLARDVSGEPLRHWIRQALEEQTPYDAMVRELLVAEGPAHAPGHGATGHLMRDSGMLEDSMANTVRAFLGTRLECAQCHDHPFEPWTQEQFFGMVAFTGGMKHRLDLADLPGGDRLVALREELVGGGDRNARASFARALRPLLVGVDGTGTAQATIPDDAIHLAGETVRARTFTGEEPGPAPRPTGRRRKPRPAEVGSREAFADWVTGGAHGLFARVIANRMWAHLMGRGVIECLDDVWSHAPRDEALMAELEALVVELDYDLDAFQRVVLSTQAWRAPALPPDHPDAGIAAPVLRRLSAEQVWDSLLTLVVPDLDATLQPALTGGATEVYDAYLAAIDDPVGVMTRRFEDQLLRRTDPDAFRELVRARKAEERAEGAALREQVRPVKRELRRARKRGDVERVAALETELDGLGGPRRTRAGLRDLHRASELAQPAPPGHLLARFGQSDRETIDNGFRDDTVPQLLVMLNGFAERELLDGEADALLMDDLGACGSAEERLGTAWRSVLGREPTASERALWLADLQHDPAGATRDLVWCLLNSHEFQFTP